VHQIGDQPRLIMQFSYLTVTSFFAGSNNLNMRDNRHTQTTSIWETIDIHKQTNSIWETIDIHKQTTSIWETIDIHKQTNKTTLRFSIF